MLRWKAQHWFVNSPSAAVFHPLTVSGTTPRRTTSGGPPTRSSFIVVSERVVGRGAQHRTNWTMWDPPTRERSAGDPHCSQRRRRRRSDPDHRQPEQAQRLLGCHGRDPADRARPGRRRPVGARGRRHRRGWLLLVRSRPAGGPRAPGHRGRPRRERRVQPTVGDPHPGDRGDRRTGVRRGLHPRPQLRPAGRDAGSPVLRGGCGDRPGAGRGPAQQAARSGGLPGGLPVAGHRGAVRRGRGRAPRVRHGGPRRRPRSGAWRSRGRSRPCRRRSSRRSRRA